VRTAVCSVKTHYANITLAGLSKEDRVRRREARRLERRKARKLAKAAASQLDLFAAGEDGDRDDDDDDGARAVESDAASSNDEDDDTAHTRLTSLVERAEFSRVASLEHSRCVVLGRGVSKTARSMLA
jgi:hypothetical protein